MTLAGRLRRRGVNLAVRRRAWGDSGRFGEAWGDSGRSAEPWGDLWQVGGDVG